MPSNVILLAEDNPDDALIFKLMFKRAALPHALQVVEDGQQAIDWLSGKGIYSDRQKHPLPDVLLLDLKMPVKTGFEVLEWLRTRTDFKELSAIVLSSSDDPKDIKRASELGAAKYFVKSPQLQDLLQYLRSN
jgi:CheY-like chemotaxis protein